MRTLTLSPLLLSALVLAGCNSSSNNSNTPAQDPGSSTAKPLSLKLLHINDHHSHLDESKTKLTLGDQTVRIKTGGFPRVVSKMQALADQTDTPVLKLHAGDAITGDLYYTLFKGKADAALMNEVCFDYFALGNHEFDGGDAGLKTFLDALAGGNCATKTEVLAANVVPTVGESPLATNTVTDYFKPYSVREMGGEKVGIIGIDIAEKTKQSSRPNASTQFLDETSTAQKYIDELTAQGVNKIVLMTHYQYKNDLTLAANLTGVDVIIGGDSHTLLGDFKDYGLNTAGAYPTEITDKAGNKVCVAQAWQYAQVVGELNVDFDDKGLVTACAGTPHLLLGETMQKKNSEGDYVDLSGDDLQKVQTLIAQAPQLSPTTPAASAESLLAGYRNQVDVLTKEVIGEAAETLCLERIPGQGKSSACDKTATAAHGSDISHLVALAFRQQSLASDIAIQNAGGVRTDILQGAITIGDAYKLLPFKNTLVDLKMTGSEIINVLEEALDYALNGSTGAYPYAYGLRYHVDLSQPKGQRITQHQVLLKGETTWSSLETERTYTVVTNDFIASGKDGYLTFKTVADDGRAVDTYLDYAQAFVDYVRQQGTINKLPSDAYSTHRFVNQAGELQE